MMPCLDFGRFVHLHFPVSALLATPDVSSFYVVVAQFGSLSSPYNTIDIVLLAPVTKAAHWPPLATANLQYCHCRNIKMGERLKN